jgi:uncharacterized SAM-binding protein YcdF (DUF218 family)
MMSLLNDLKPWIQLLALPPMPLLILLVLGLSLWRRHRIVGHSLLGLSLLGLWFSFTEVGADQLQRLLLGVPSALSAAQIDTLRAAPDTAVLVLGAGIHQQAPEYGGPSLKALTLERLRYGIWLARRTSLPLGFTGGLGRSSEAGDATEAQIAQQVATDEFGLPLRWLESRARDTRENAALSLPLLQRDGIRRIVLVTHAHHMPRAARAFRRVAGNGIELVLAPVGLRNDTPYTSPDWFPSGEGFRRLRYVIYEWLGLRAGH